ncbi:ASCH domain-containing protein [Massilia jejuensis]|uniref:ASCH domain-containing protein n=1 Tax=Massilia jejuensis TaxID=648894 RepID=A0ABW0PAY6_9BURK
MKRHKKLTFYGVDENDDSLVRAVIAGHKTVTADTVEDYHKGYGELGDGGYVAGDIIDVHDRKGRPRCTIRALEVRVIRFGAIPEDVWRGEMFSSAEEFREVHIGCLPHLDLHDDVEFVTLHFELLAVTPVS